MKAKRSKFWQAAVCAALLALSAACTKTPNDAQVVSDVQAKLSTDSGLQSKQLTVQSSNGTVTLSGIVDNDSERDAAAKYAASEPGVRTVINNLRVGTEQANAGPSPKSSSAGAVERSTPRRRQKARSDQQEMANADYRNEPAPNQQQPPASDPAPPAQAQTPPPQPQLATVTVPSGTAIVVRLIDTIDSATAQSGDKFHATLDAPIAIDDDVVVPAHYDVEGHVVNAQASGKFAGQALVVLQLDRIKVGDRSYDIQTDQFSQKTNSRGKNTAEKVGAGAVAGAILGGIFGGGKGAAIGSAAGAGAGGGVQAASKKPDIKLSSERVLNFTLQAPVTLVPTTKPAREGQRLDPSNSQ
ncbi:MAG TPA: BON domain-containing protein [Terriglobales bacterium]|nr:BON domain-containing protein [Terriglobales bacterium]